MVAARGAHRVVPFSFKGVIKALWYGEAIGPIDTTAHAKAVEACTTLLGKRDDWVAIGASDDHSAQIGRPHAAMRAKQINTLHPMLIGSLWNFRQTTRPYNRLARVSPVAILRRVSICQ